MVYYFDNAASTRPYDEVIEYYSQLLKTEYANPSALHKFGYEASKLVDRAKEEVTAIHGLKGYDVVFTSGATESVNLAVKGTIDRFEDITKTHIVTTPIEHACVTNTAMFLEEKGSSVTYLPVDRYGRVSPEDVKAAINEHTKIVSVIWVNNETGIIQDIDAIAKAVREVRKDIVFHIDATQGFGKIPVDLKCADLISVSAHKFHGFKGIGMLYIKKGVHLNGIMMGGGQQDNLRSGTINAPMIASLGKTVSLTDPAKNRETMTAVRDYLYGRIRDTFGDEVINSRIYEADYAPHILNISFTGLKGEVILHMLEDSDIYVSTSSACSARKKLKSVLDHLGYSSERMGGTIRISICEYNTVEECDFLIEKLGEAVKLLRSLRG